MNPTASKVMNYYKNVKNSLGLTEDVSFNEYYIMKKPKSL